MKARAGLRINFILERGADPVLYDCLSRFRKNLRAQQLRNLAHDGALMRMRWLGEERTPAASPPGPSIRIEHAHPAEDEQRDADNAARNMFAQWIEDKQ